MVLDLRYCCLGDVGASCCAVHWQVWLGYCFETRCIGESSRRSRLSVWLHFSDLHHIPFQLYSATVSVLICLSDSLVLTSIDPYLTR